MPQCRTKQTTINDRYSAYLHNALKDLRSNDRMNRIESNRIGLCIGLCVFDCIECIDCDRYSFVIWYWVCVVPLYKKLHWSFETFKASMIQIKIKYTVSTDNLREV